MDDVEKIARTATDAIESACQAERLIWSLGSGKAKDVADRIFAAHLRSYGEQCRRAGAEAMREAAADFAGKRIGNGDTHGVIAAGIRELPLPSAAEAAT